MHVIRHDHPGVQLILPEFYPTPDGASNILSDRPLFQERGAAACLTEQTVHGGESLSGRQLMWNEDTVRREAVVQPKGDEERRADNVNVWKAARRQ